MQTLFFRRFNLIWPTINDVRDVLKQVLSGYQVDSDQIDNAGLVVTEYLTNLIRHAIGEDEIVTLVFNQLDGQIELQIFDQTPFFNFLHNDTDTIDIQDGVLREGGMGMALIKHLFPNSRYCKVNAQNCFSVRFDQALTKPNLVVVDDQVLVLKLVEEYLSDDYNVISFSSENEALDFLSNNNVDVLLLDMHLEHSTAIDLIERLQNRRGSAQTSVIIMSASNDLATRQQACSMGIDDFVAKPLQRDEIKLTLERILTRRKQINLESHQMGASTRKPPYSDNHVTINSSLSMTVMGNTNQPDSGDFWLLSDQGEFKFLLLADVMGHGVKANIEAQKIKGFLHGFCQAKVKSIELLFEGLSRVMYQESITEQSIVTLLGLQINGRDVGWISAGHPQAILVDEHNRIYSCEGNQPLVGLAPEYSYESYHLHLKKGQRLILYSDGFTENLDRKMSMVELLPSLLPEPSLNNQDWTQELWQNSLPLLSKDIDDSSLLIIN